MKWLTGFLQKINNLKKRHKFLAKISFKRKNNSGYAYTNTRVRVMKTKLLKRDDYSKLLKMSFPEIARFMQETEYKKEISELAPFYEESNLIEYSLNRNLENLYNKIFAFSINASQEQVKLYLKKFDVLNVKTYLRGKHSGKSNEMILLELVCAGELGRKFFERALENATDFNKAILELKGTEYHFIAEKFKSDLTKMEDELDKHYYKTLLEKAEIELENFVRDEIKTKNILNKVRAKKSEVKLELIEGEADAKIVLPQKHTDLENRIFLKKYLLSRGNKMASEFKRNIRPVLGYFISKENEVSNLRLIVRGKASGLPLDLIEQQLVI